MIPRISITSDAPIAAAALGTLSAAIGAGVAAATFVEGAALQGRVKARAAGRPGPRMRTGDYNRSIGLAVGTPDGNPTAWVGTNAPQGRRLEYGFVGVDALGRHFDQPPYPHFGPALAESEPRFLAAIDRVIAGLT